MAIRVDWPQDYVERFWTLYPRKVGKGAARKALEQARKHGHSFDRIMAGLERYASRADRSRMQFIPHASTWVNQERWEDRDLPTPDRPGGFAGVLYDHMTCGDGGQHGEGFADHGPASAPAVVDARADADEPRLL